MQFSFKLFLEMLISIMKSQLYKSFWLYTVGKLCTGFPINYLQSPDSKAAGKQAKLRGKMKPAQLPAQRTWLTSFTPRGSWAGLSQTSSKPNQALWAGLFAEKTGSLSFNYLISYKAPESRYMSQCSPEESYLMPTRPESTTTLHSPCVPDTHLISPGRAKVRV